MAEAEGSSGTDPEARVLYLTTRDVATPRTGADNRAKHLYAGLERSFSVDLVYFDRTDGGDNERGGDGDSSGVRGHTADGGVSVPYPASELLAILSFGFFRAVLRTVRSEEYDVVITSGIGGVIYGLVASLLARAAFVFDDHNVEHELAREASMPRFVVVYALERLSCALAALVVVPTTETEVVLDPWVRGDLEVVTNGFDAETFTPDGERRPFDDRTLLFFGNFRYEPNVEATEYLIEDLCPRLATADVDATVRIAGPGYERIAEAHELPDSLEVLGFVEDLPATIRGAELVVVPLSTGSGSRLKIIESLACGTTVVSTPIGAEGWPTEWENLVIADPASFADSAIDALDDVAFDRSELDEYARYSWQSQSARFVEFVRSITEGGG